MSAKGLPPVVEIPHKSFAERCYIRAMPQVDHVTHLGGISQTDCKMMPCDSVGKTAGAEYLDLSCRGLNFAPPDCASLFLEM